MTLFDLMILCLALFAAALFFGGPIVEAWIFHDPGVTLNRRHHDHLIPRTPRAPR